MGGKGGAPKTRISICKKYVLAHHTNQVKPECSSTWHYPQCSTVDSIQSTIDIQITITMGNNRLPSVPCTHGQHQQSTPVDTLCAILPPVCILPSPSAQVTFLLLSLSTELNTHHINTPSSPLPLFTVGFLFCFVLAPFYPLQRLSPCQSITYLFITPVACV